MGKLESLGNELIAVELIHGALAIRVLCLYIIGNSLVDYIPAVNNILITVDNGEDMLLHAGIEYLFRRVVLIHPFPDLIMPHQAVTTHLDAVLATEIGNTVGIVPIELSLGRLCGLRLHIVFSRYAVKLLFDKSLLLSICYITLINGDSDFEIVLVGIFQSLGIGNATHHGKHCRHKNSSSHKFFI